MDNSNHIDVNKLTKEAEAGHGHYVGSILDRLPFEEQIHIAHEIANLSMERCELPGYPQIEFFMHEYRGDRNSANGYSVIQLCRKKPDGWLGLFDKEDLIYESSLNLTTGEKAAINRDF